MRVLLVSANREKLPSPVVPLGMLLVASSLREPSAAGGKGDGHEVALCDLCFEPDVEGALARAVAEFRPDVVGLGLRNLHTNAYDGTEGLVAEYDAVVRALRGLSGAPIVLGGAGFSLRPTTLLERLGADHGVVGEGERAMRELVDALAATGAAPRIVHGRAAELGRGPVPLRRGPRPASSDLDLLPPPARDLVDPRYHAYDGTANVQTKRGCAFSCTYCDYPDLEGSRVRVRAPEAIADEVTALAEDPTISHVFFVDSVFNVPRSHAIATSEALAARGVPLPWVCYASPASLDEATVRAMARGGCQGAEIGSDAGTERQLERLKKPFKLADIRRAHDLFVDHGIHDVHTFVLGAEGETEAETRETLEFVDRLDPDMAVFIAFLEDRESMSVHRARHRDAILELLAREAPKRPGWVVPELGIRFGEKLSRVMRRAGIRGPSWLPLARARRKDMLDSLERALIAE